MFDPRVAEDAIVQVGFRDRDWETESGLDVFEAAGGAMKAVVREYPMRVTNGEAELEFKPVIGKAVLSAIEILPVR